MHLLIAEDGTLSLEDVDDLKRFSIVEANPGAVRGCASGALADIGEPADDDHYWLSAEAVLALSARKDDPEWVAAFWVMLKKVEQYGFSDMQARRVKAHVESTRPGMAG